MTAAAAAALAEDFYYFDAYPAAEFEILDIDRDGAQSKVPRPKPPRRVKRTCSWLPKKSWQPTAGARKRAGQGDGTAEAIQGGDDEN